MLVLATIWIKSIRSTLVFFASWLIALCVGNAAWRVLSLDDPPEPDYEEGQEVDWKETNWGSLLGSIFIGLAAFLLILWLPHMR